VVADHQQQEISEIEESSMVQELVHGQFHQERLQFRFTSGVVEEQQLVLQLLHKVAEAEAVTLEQNML
jgi:hypothetical protein